MKKVLSLVIMMVLLVVNCLTGYCESEESAILDVIWANALERQEEEWFSDSRSRALLTVMLSLDLALAVEEEGFDIASAMVENTYVGKDGRVLCVYLHGEKSDFLIIYEPITGNAIYSCMGKHSDFAVELALDKKCADGYYVNNLEDLGDVMDELLLIIDEFQ